MQLDISISPDVTCPVVHVAGELDLATKDALARLLEHLVSQGPERIVVDLAAVSFIDPAGIRAFILAAQRLGDGHLALAAPQPRVARLLALAGLAPLIEVWDTLELAGASRELT